MMEFRSPNLKEEELKRKTTESLESDRVRLLMDQPFIGAILIRQNLVPVVDSRCPTASTDGQNIFVNPSFYFSLTPAERRFLLAHEVWHTVYLHPLRTIHFFRNRRPNPKLFRIAKDMEVNRMLCREKFKAPVHACLPPPEWENLNAESIYEKLLHSAESIPDSRFDIHLEKGQDAPVDFPAEGTEVPVIDPDYEVDFGENPEELAREKVLEATVQYEKLRGELPDHLEQIVKKFQERRMNWRELLAQFVTPCFGGERHWLPPNRRYISRGLYLQSRRDIRIQAVLAIDTSGSTSDDLPQFVSELTSLFNSFGQYELTVICCDAEIQSVETYTPENPIDIGRIKFKGGGGTSFIPVFDYVEKHLPETQILIYFTDGYGDQPEKPPYPVLWTLTPGGRNMIPWGDEINLTLAR